MVSGPATGPRQATIALTALLAGTGLTVVTALLGRLAWSIATGPAVARDPSAVLVAATACGAALLATRLVLCSAACVLAVLVGRSPVAAGRAARVALSTSPPALRPGLSALLAGSLAIGVAGPALAAAPPSAVAAGGSGRRSVATAADESLPAPGWSALPVPGWSALPAPGWSALAAPGSRPTAPRRSPAIVQAAPDVHLVTGTGARSAAPDDELVVRRGDSLWHLAARSLGPSATVAEIAAEWPRWWRANRDVIGADPDLIVPGARLRAPAPATTDP